MFTKEVKTNRRGRQIRKARANKKFRNPDGRKKAAEAHLRKITNRGNVATKRAKTAERHAAIDLQDVCEHNMAIS